MKQKLQLHVSILWKIIPTCYKGEKWRRYMYNPDIGTLCKAQYVWTYPRGGSGCKTICYMLLPHPVSKKIWYVAEWLIWAIIARFWLATVQQKQQPVKTRRQEWELFHAFFLSQIVFSFDLSLELLVPCSRLPPPAWEHGLVVHQLAIGRHSLIRRPALCTTGSSRPGQARALLG